MQQRGCWVLLLSFDLLASSTPLRAQSSFRGRVATQGDNSIADAEVSIAGQATQTDSGGKFAILAVPVGTHLVRIRRIGYAPKVLSATFAANEAKSVTIVLERGPEDLPELNVTVKNVKPVEYGWTSRYDDYFRRRQVGLGRFLSRPDIERMHAARTPNLLAGIAGIGLRFYHLGPGGTGVEFRRCEKVGVWVDGRLQTAPTILGENASGALERALGELLESIAPSQIELMEVYRGPAEMPAEYLGDACAAVVIWTR